MRYAERPAARAEGGTRSVFTREQQAVIEHPGGHAPVGTVAGSGGLNANLIQGTADLFGGYLWMR
jgi:hypothetical protein